jgi:hypothetical protein
VKKVLTSNFCLKLSFMSSFWIKSGSPSVLALKLPQIRTSPLLQNCEISFSICVKISSESCWQVPIFVCQVLTILRN